MMSRTRTLLLGSGIAAILIVLVVGSSPAQIMTTVAPGVKVEEPVRITTTVVSFSETSYTIPDDRDLIVTDVVATCRTINPCLLSVFGPSHNSSDALLIIVVPATSTFSHAFTTGFRLPGGNGGQLFIQNSNQPEATTNLFVTITGYLVRK